MGHAPVLVGTAEARPAHRQAKSAGGSQVLDPPTSVDKWVALTGLFVLLMLNIAVPVWKISTVPVRGMFAIALLIALSALHPVQVVRAVRDNVILLRLVAGLSIIGIFVSLANGAPAGVVAQAVIEMHVQAAVMIVLAFVIAYVCGAGPVMLVVVAAIAVSGAVALLQAAGMEAAWDIRRSLSQVQGQEDLLVAGENRPLGLSFSPIQLATQLCLAFAAYAAVRDKGIGRRNGSADADPTIVPALGLFAAVCVACGTRSPVLGGVLFFAIYAAQRRGAAFSLLILAGGLAAYLLAPIIIETIQSTQPRMVRADDKSATGRTSLFTFGLLLFRDNPLGYGLGFDPTEHWTRYWHDLYTLPSAVVIQSRQLHNYALNMLNTYGVGLLLLAPAVFGLLRRGRRSLIFFIPYVVHISFHNSGPLWNDMIIWFVIAAVSVARPAPSASERRSERRRSRRLVARPSRRRPRLRAG